LTTIIIPVSNQLEFTQQCLASLKEHTRPEWELIVIDNGSNDGTAAYLAGVRDMASVPVTVVTNLTNVGFPAAVNQGLRLARGEYLVLLNNVVVVTDAWLDQLIGLVNAKRGQDAEASPPPSAGIVPGSAESTPPGPPSTRGGNGLRRRGRATMLCRHCARFCRVHPPALCRHCARFCGVHPPALCRHCARFCEVHPPWPPLQEGGDGLC
jgi:glycosyltransferase involved in cell wall biosynthesis